MNLYHVTKFSPYFSFTVYCFYTKISSFTPALSIRIALDCFYLLIFYSEKFSTDVCRLPYAVNVNLNLSISPLRKISDSLFLFQCYCLFALFRVTFILQSLYLMVSDTAISKNVVGRKAKSGNVGCFKSVFCWQTITPLN